MSLRELVADAACAPNGGAGPSSSSANPLSNLASSVLDAPPGASQFQGNRNTHNVPPAHYSLLLDDAPPSTFPPHMQLDINNDSYGGYESNVSAVQSDPRVLVDEFLAAHPELRPYVTRSRTYIPSLPSYFPAFSSISYSRLPPLDANAATARFEAAFARPSSSRHLRHYPHAPMSLRAQAAAFPPSVASPSLKTRQENFKHAAQNLDSYALPRDDGENAQRLDGMQPSLQNTLQDRARETARGNGLLGQEENFESQVSEFMSLLAEQSANPVVPDPVVQNADEDWESEFTNMKISDHARSISQSMSYRHEDRMNQSRLRKFADTLANFDGSVDWADEKDLSYVADLNAKLDEDESKVWGDEFAAATNSASILASSWGDTFVSAENGQESVASGTKVGDGNSRDAVESPFVDSFHNDLFDYLGQDPATVAYEFQGENRFMSLSPAQALAEGKRFRSEGHLSLAVCAFEAAVAAYDKSGGDQRAEAWFLLGTTHAECDDDLRAIQAFLRCLKCYEDDSFLNSSVSECRNPFLPEALLALGVCYTNELNTAKALAYLRQWLDARDLTGKYNPKDLAFPFSPMDADRSLDENGEGLKSEHSRLLARTNEAAREHPGDVDICIALGVLHNLSRDYDMAAEALRMAVTLKPNDSRLWNKLGATLANGNESDDALRAYRKAVDLSPTYIRAWVNVGTAYANRADYYKAARYYLKSLSMHDANVPGGEDVSATKENRTRTFGVNTNDMTHVWGYLRTTLVALQREDLLPFVESGNVEKFRKYIPF